MAFYTKTGRKIRAKNRSLIGMSREHRFETFEHTADIGVIGRGKTRAEAFENTAYGMITVIADPAKYSLTDKVEVLADGIDDIGLLERFLSKMLILIDGDGLLPLDFHIVEMEDERLRCEVDVRPIGDDIEWVGPTLKAVTYHQMAVEQVDDEWQTRVILDI